MLIGTDGAPVGQDPFELLVLSRLAPDAPREMFGANARTVLPLLRGALAR